MVGSSSNATNAYRHGNLIISSIALPVQGKTLFEGHWSIKSAISGHTIQYPGTGLWADEGLALLHAMEEALGFVRRHNSGQPSDLLTALINGTLEESYLLGQPAK